MSAKAQSRQLSHPDPPANAIRHQADRIQNQTHGDHDRRNTQNITQYFSRTEPADPFIKLNENRLDWLGRAIRSFRSASNRSRDTHSPLDLAWRLVLSTAMYSESFHGPSGFLRWSKEVQS